MDEKKLSFEEGIQQLENILSGLEKDDMNLDDMLASYEEGMNIVKQLKAQLTEAETKLKVLQNGEIKETAKKMLWNERYEKYKSFFVKQLDNSVKQTELPFESGSMPQKLSEAMRYSLLAGGKRLRPVMLLAAAEAEGLKAEEAFNFAAAIEMIHTYSLIHDDLPAMDNDTLRRGKPTSHCQFGEWLAILSGDALLTEAFYMMSLTDNKNALKAIKEIAFRSGARGMIAGQVADMHFENKNPCKDDVRYINLHKTADLFIAAVKTNLFTASADESKLKAAETYGENIGFAFQITDDILDIQSNSQTRNP